MLYLQKFILLGTIRLYISELTKSLDGLYPADEAVSVAEYYVSETLNLSRTELTISKNDELSEDDFLKLENRRKRLETGEPVQYVTGKAYFYGLRFLVDKNVLIPRQETEVLIDIVVKSCKNAGKIRILDIGTGSGCIAVTLKKHLPDALVYALDISEGALDVCKKNAELNGVDVDAFIFDILSWNSFPVQGKFDLIISNPPYVLESEKQLMHRNVVGFEPATALYVKDENPLLFYEVISRFAALNLKKGGELYFEINERFAAEVVELNESSGLSGHKIIEDLNLKPRFVISHL